MGFSSMRRRLGWLGKIVIIHSCLTILFALLSGFCWYIGETSLAIGALGPMGASLIGAIGFYRKIRRQKPKKFA